MGVTNSARRAGILLHITSLPSPYGLGSLGRDAYDFVDFLVAAGQSVWQILPIGPSGGGYSPYQPSSAYAGNPWLIDLDTLVSDGLLTKKEVRDGWTVASRTARNIAPDSAAFSIQKKFRDPLLEKATERFDTKSVGYSRFCKENKEWLDIYVQFCGEDNSEYTKRIQYIFYKQWKELKSYANLKGISIVGDLPFYVSADSSDFLLGPKAFDVCADGSPASSGGTPPDAFAPEGQIWNNPVYDWAKRPKEAYAFWQARIAHATKLFDGVRIDHFRGLSEYYAIPLIAGKKSEWRLGPGRQFVDRIRASFPGFEIVAEDLGDLSDEARALVKYSGFPGMIILQFAFSGDADNLYLPHAIGQNSWVYTGTHDNDTLVGWAHGAPKNEVRFAMDYLGVSKRIDLPYACIRAALSSRANTCIIPMQDWLNLGSTARFNKPGSVGGRNWKWRLAPGTLTTRLAEQLRYPTKDLYNR